MRSPRAASSVRVASRSDTRCRRTGAVAREVAGQDEARTVGTDRHLGDARVHCLDREDHSRAEHVAIEGEVCRDVAAGQVEQIKALDRHGRIVPSAAEPARARFLAHRQGRQGTDRLGEDLPHRRRGADDRLGPRLTVWDVTLLSHVPTGFYGPPWPTTCTLVAVRPHRPAPRAPADRRARRRLARVGRPCTAARLRDAGRRRTAAGGRRRPELEQPSQPRSVSAGPETSTDAAG